MPTETPQFANRIRRLRASPIRDILKILEDPEIISFAGGLPDAESFPQLSLPEVPPSTLQYGPSEGDTRLRKLVAEDLRKRGIVCTYEQVILLSGSQQGIDLVAKLFVEPQTQVLVESPTYLAALQVFELFGARLISFSPQQVEALLDRNSITGDCARQDPADRDRTELTCIEPRLAYLNPTFQNPTGYCYTWEERKALADYCDRNKVPVFEDDPYRALAYETCCRTPIVSLVKDTDWVYQSSFSKTLAPGLRLGYLVCSQNLVVPITRLKQAADLHSNRLSQHIVLKQIQSANYDEHLQQIIQRYDNKRRLFDYYLKQHFADLAQWTRPKGGLFYWLSLATETPIDTRELLPTACAEKVAFMPGEPFFAYQSAGTDGPKVEGQASSAANRPPADINIGSNNRCGQFRLNFSLSNEAQMDRGLRTLSRVIKNALSGKRGTA